MKNITRNALVFTLLVVPLIYIWTIYPSLPAIVPTHFKMDGTPDDYSRKQSLPWIIFLLSGISAGTYALVKNLPRFDPKKSASLSGGRLQTIGLAVVALLSLCSCAAIYASAHVGLAIHHLLYPAISIFFVITGNAMYNIKPNYFVGIRVPWTLEHEDNWRATHHLAGRLWVIGGLLMTIATLFLNARWGYYLFMSGSAMLALIPILYSFWYFKTNQGTVS